MSLNVEIFFMWVFRMKFVYFVVFFFEFKVFLENIERLIMKLFFFYFFYRLVVIRCLCEKFIVLYNIV